jgi:hypothetical protein
MGVDNNAKTDFKLEALEIIKFKFGNKKYNFINIYLF